MDKETILRKVKNVLEQVRPYLQQDGGDVNFVELTDDNTMGTHQLWQLPVFIGSILLLKITRRKHRRRYIVKLS